MQAADRYCLFIPVRLLRLLVPEAAAVVVDGSHDPFAVLRRSTGTSAAVHGERQRDGRTTQPGNEHLLLRPGVRRYPCPSASCPQGDHASVHCVLFAFREVQMPIFARELFRCVPAFQKFAIVQPRYRCFEYLFASILSY